MAERQQAAWAWPRLLAEPGPRRTAALLALRRRQLKEAGGAQRFRRAGGLRALLPLLERAAGAGAGAGAEGGGRELDLALSVLGNCCTEEAARREVQRLGGIPPLVAILKTTTSLSVQNRATRALGNLALEPENSVMIHQLGAVPPLIRLLSAVEDADCLHSATRTLRILSDTPPHRSSLTSLGALAPLLALLSRPETPLLTSCLRALSALTRSCPAPLASQLGGAGAPELLAPLFSHLCPGVREAALSCLANLCGRPCLRPGLGRAGAVGALVRELRRDPGSPSAPSHLRALCLCCREAVNRARVRQEGGLELLLSLLGRPEHRAGHPRIVAAFLSFFYDQDALDLLAAGGLVPLLVERLGRGSGGGGGGRGAEEEEGEAESFDFPSERDGEMEKMADEGSGSFRSLRSWLVSEGYIEGPSDLPPAPSHPSSPSPLPPGGTPSGSVPLSPGSPPPLPPGRGAPSPETPALLLLSRYSQAEEPPAGLLSEAGLRGMLTYLSQGRPGASRCFRLLSRLFCNPNCLEALIRARAAPLVRARLVRGLAGDELSPRREERAGGESRWLQELGEVLLRNLGAQAESAFGVGTLTHLLLSGTESEKTACAVALPLLCRNETVRRRLLLDHGGLPLLLCALLSTGDPLSAFGASEAVSELAGTPEEGGEGPEEEGVPVRCPYLEALGSGGGPDLHFVLDGGERLGAVRGRVSGSSAVFAALLSGPFSESAQREVRLRELDPSTCCLLLHHLHGCLPPSCPSLRLYPPLGGGSPPQLLPGSPLGLALSAADRFLLGGLSEDLGVRALRGLPPDRLPELYRLARGLGIAPLARRALGRILMGPSHPRDRPAMWAGLLGGGEEEGEREEVLGCLCGLLTECL